MFTYIELSYWIASGIPVMSMVKNSTHMWKEFVLYFTKGRTFLAVTTDAWASKIVKLFITYTAHFIHANYSLHNY